jgi:hypothetical protein
MDRIPYTQGTRAYQAAQAVLRGETDNKTTAADTRLKLKNVQNIRSMIGRLRKSGAIPMSNLTSAATVVNDSLPPSPSSPSSPSSLPSPVLPPVQQPQVIAQPPLREAVPAPSARQKPDGEEEMTEGKERTDGTGQESSQEGDGRESLGKNSSPSRTLGKDIREAKEGMRLVKDSQVGNEMEECGRGLLAVEGAESPSSDLIGLVVLLNAYETAAQAPRGNACGASSHKWVEDDVALQGESLHEVEHPGFALLQPAQAFLISRTVGHVANPLARVVSLQVP